MRRGDNLSENKIYSINGPVIMNNIFDGIESPLRDIAMKSGAFISPGCNVEALDSKKEWDVTLKVK
ncbi:MAG TPA: hypothetical protein VLM88_01710, partial [Proteiniclasticum sp.]|nr:hypothetical protein [Proteiniclasticum sp.]